MNSKSKFCYEKETLTLTKYVCFCSCSFFSFSCFFSVWPTSSFFFYLTESLHQVEIKYIRIQSICTFRSHFQNNTFPVNSINPKSISNTIPYSVCCNFLCFLLLAHQRKWSLKAQHHVISPVMSTNQKQLFLANQILRCRILPNQIALQMSHPSLKSAFLPSQKCLERQ